jgi:hypothetical protein
MEKGIYISPLALRIGIFGLVLLLIAALASQAPDIRRYIKFETM